MNMFVSAFRDILLQEADFHFLFFTHWMRNVSHTTLIHPDSKIDASWTSAVDSPVGRRSTVRGPFVLDRRCHPFAVSLFHPHSPLCPYLMPDKRDIMASHQPHSQTKARHTPRTLRAGAHPTIAHDVVVSAAHACGEERHREGCDKRCLPPAGRLRHWSAPPPGPPHCRTIVGSVAAAVGAHPSTDPLTVAPRQREPPARQ